MPDGAFAPQARACYAGARMHDLSQLRIRLHAALTSGILLAGCGPAPQGGAPVAAKSAPPAATPASPAPVQPAPPRVLEPLPELPPLPDYPARTGMDPFDPDGVEEEGCPNGDWCGSPKAAARFQVQSPEVELGCPTRLMGKPDPGVTASDRTYKGLSLNPMMMGRLRKIATAEKRKASGDANVCCYHWFDYCSGRPLLDGEAALAAPVRAGDAWLGEPVTEDMLCGAPLSPAGRARLAAAWLEDARMEHASVASFARAALELLAVGAPAELVGACAAAGADEVRHARLCFSLAAAYGGEAQGPGPLPPALPRVGGLVALACDTFREGCVGETLAALGALRAARRCQIPAVRAVLEEIAEDEARHAELAWATLAWAVQVGGAEVAGAVAAVAEELRALGTEPAEEDPAAAELAPHGRLGAAARVALREEAWEGLLGEALALVLRPADSCGRPAGPSKVVGWPSDSASCSS